jgi:hypothetical protein
MGLLRRGNNRIGATWQRTTHEGEAATKELMRAIEAGDADDLRARARQGELAYWRLLFEQPAFWVYQFQQLEGDLTACADKQRATRLCDQGRAFVSHNNVDGLRNVVRELWRLMPTEAVEEAKRGYQSGIVKTGH